MKKMMAILLALLMLVSMMACAAKNDTEETVGGENVADVGAADEIGAEDPNEADDSNPADSAEDRVEADGEGDTEVGVDAVGAESALGILTTVWNSFAEDEKFAVWGGDYSEDNMVDGAPGVVGLEDAASVEYLLNVPAEIVEKCDEAASLIHGMNVNTFTCGVVRLIDAADLDDAAASVKEYIQGKQWMCGFPDKVFVAAMGNYLIELIGSEQNVNAFRDHLTAEYEAVTILTDEFIG